MTKATKLRGAQLTIMEGGVSRQVGVDLWIGQVALLTKEVQNPLPELRLVTVSFANLEALFAEKEESVYVKKPWLKLQHQYEAHKGRGRRR